MVLVWLEGLQRRSELRPANFLARSLGIQSLCERFIHMHSQREPDQSQTSVRGKAVYVFLTRC